MKRRGFLAGILAAGIAPAIVHNPMKIFVPKQEIAIPKLGRGMRGPIYHIDEMAWFSEEMDTVRGRVIQGEFGEAFFPTVVLLPDELGFPISMNGMDKNSNRLLGALRDLRASA